MPPTVSSAEPVSDLRYQYLLHIFTNLLLLLHASSAIKELQFHLWEDPMMMISNHRLRSSSWWRWWWWCRLAHPSRNLNSTCGKLPWWWLVIIDHDHHQEGDDDDDDDADSLSHQGTSIPCVGGSHAPSPATSPQEQKSRIWLEENLQMWFAQNVQI